MRHAMLQMPLKAGGYAPVKAGARFWKKAETPSCMSRESHALLRSSCSSSKRSGLAVERGDLLVLGAASSELQRPPRASALLERRSGVRRRAPRLPARSFRQAVGRERGRLRERGQLPLEQPHHHRRLSSRGAPAREGQIRRLHRPSRARSPSRHTREAMTAAISDTLAVSWSAGTHLQRGVHGEAYGGDAWEARGRGARVEEAVARRLLGGERRGGEEHPLDHVQRQHPEEVREAARVVGQADLAEGREIEGGRGRSREAAGGRRRSREVEGGGRGRSREVEGGRRASPWRA